MRKPVRERLRLLVLHGIEPDGISLAKQMMSEYPSVPCMDDDWNMIFDPAAASQWCNDNIPKQHWDRTRHLFLFTTKQHEIWFKMRWIGALDAED